MNWDNVERLWYHTFHHAMRVTPEERPLLMTEPPLHGNKEREEMASLLFEKFAVPKLYVQSQAVLSLFATGRTTGMLLSSMYRPIPGSRHHVI